MTAAIAHHCDATGRLDEGRECGSLIGLGVRTLSVGAARLADVAERIAAADAAECAAVAARALQATNVEQVWANVQAP